MAKAKERYMGNVYPTKSFGDVVVIDYESSLKIKIQFEDGNTAYCRGGDLLNGEVNNPFHKTVCGVGFIGVGPHTKGRSKIALTKWHSMMTRCYSSEYHKDKPTYKDKSVDEQWHNFQEFAEWCSWQVGFSQNWQLDKDIVQKGNKVYCPDYCVFLPNEINCTVNLQTANRGNCLVGVTQIPSGKYRAQWQEDGRQQYSKVFTDEVDCFEFYKYNKERVVKTLADKWKDQLDPRSYHALMNFEVSIYD